MRSVTLEIAWLKELFHSYGRIIRTGDVIISGSGFKLSCGNNGSLLKTVSTLAALKAFVLTKPMEG
jgi:hypothetical protein